MRLLASTISAGSIYMVLPEADSSWTMPLILRLCIVSTGITTRPSRTEGDVSLSIYPAWTAWASTRRMAAFIDPVAADIDERIWANSGVALSFMLPKRSMIRSILRQISGNGVIPTAIVSSAGYADIPSSERCAAKNEATSAIAPSERRTAPRSSADIYVPAMRIAAIAGVTSVIAPRFSSSSLAIMVCISAVVCSLNDTVS